MHSGVHFRILLGIPLGTDISPKIPLEISPGTPPSILLGIPRRINFRTLPGYFQGPLWRFLSEFLHWFIFCGLLPRWNFFLTSVEDLCEDLIKDSSMGLSRESFMDFLWDFPVYPSVISTSSLSGIHLWSLIPPESPPVIYSDYSSEIPWETFPRNKWRIPHGTLSLILPEILLAISSGILSRIIYEIA